MKVLITSGGTREPIDGVRYITNFSTGSTGSKIAERLSVLGCEVVYLHGVDAKLPAGDLRTMRFCSFEDLDSQLRDLLGSEPFDAVIHLAAVSDFSLEKIETEDGRFLSPSSEGKMDSGESIKLHMKKNFKILPKLKSYALKGKTPLVVGFKLTNSASDEEVKSKIAKILQAGGIDFVVHNDLQEVTASFHIAEIYSSSGQQLAQTSSKVDLADKLDELIKGELDR